MNYIFQKSDVRQLYSQALRAAGENREGLCGAYLKAARKVVLKGKHWSEFSDKDARQIYPGLTVAKFYSLFGDDRTDFATSTWLSPAAEAMRQRHLATLQRQPVKLRVIPNVMPVIFTMPVPAIAA